MNWTRAAFPPLPSMGKFVSTAGSFAAANTRTKPGGRKCCPPIGETKDTKRPLSSAGNEPTTTVAWLVTKPRLLLAVRVKVRVPVTLATREVAPVTSPIPLLRLTAVAPATLQCRVTVPLVGKVAGLAVKERICGNDWGTRKARKNWREFVCGVTVKFVCPGTVRRYGVQLVELSRLLRR